MTTKEYLFLNICQKLIHAPIALMKSPFVQPTHHHRKPPAGLLLEFFYDTEDKRAKTIDSPMGWIVSFIYVTCWYALTSMYSLDSANDVQTPALRTATKRWHTVHSRRSSRNQETPDCSYTYTWRPPAPSHANTLSATIQYRSTPYKPQVPSLFHSISLDFWIVFLTPRRQSPASADGFIFYFVYLDLQLN